MRTVDAPVFLLRGSEMTSTIVSISTGHAWPPTGRALARLSLWERVALGIGLAEIPLQIDKYLMFHERDAALGAVGGLNLSVTSLALAVLYSLWLADAATRRRRATSGVLLGIPMLLYIAAVTLSVTVARSPMLTLFDVALLLQAYALFFYIANRVRDRHDVVFCVVALAGALVMQSVLIFGLAALGSGAAGESYVFGPLVLSIWKDGRPTGSMQSAVVAGSVLAIMWLPVVGLVFCTRSRALWCGALAASGAGLVAILLTQTRGAILTAGVGAMILGGGMWLRGWLPRWAVGVAVTLTLAGAVPLARVYEKRVAGDDDGSAASRKHLAAIAWEMICDRPLFGFGAGNCHLAGEPYADQGKYRSEWYYTIHCKYLLVWIETGIVGLVTFLVMMVNGIRHGLLAWRAGGPAWAPLGLALAAAVFGHMLHMAVDIFNSRTQVQMLWAVLGITAAVYRLSHEAKRPVVGVQDVARERGVRGLSREGGPPGFESRIESQGRRAHGH